ncbi:MAG: GDP-mannose 4,6-dehydratase [Anaerolineaceae bacterium]|nr:GDP-mannose 4,6-dehydratase [Anaerolineaceae bacterium]
MRKQVVLVTGVNGEIGHSLVAHLAENDNCDVIGLDVMPIDDSIQQYLFKFIQGDILDQMLLGRLVAEYEIRSIIHLASILSTKAEYNPETAHRVNVEGTLNLLRLAVEQATWQGKSVKFIYPSSIAAYGIPSLEIKQQLGPVTEDQWLMPTTIYGCNKLYCEHLGRYYSNFYKQLAADQTKYTIDFRGLRFPGLISAVTVPTGGTSDYGPDMLHHAAQNIPYACFVRPDSVMPFMVMPDAVKSILLLEEIERNQLSQLVYNVTSFSASAEKLKEITLDAFPNAEISFAVDQKRQHIVDTWPAEIDDKAARKDWNWKPDFDMIQSFKEYIIPGVKNRYN